MAARKLTEKQLYKQKNEILREMYEQVTPYEFFRDMFPEGSLEERGNLEIRRPNAIFTMTGVHEDKPYAFNRIVFDDLEELKLSAGAEFAITSPVTYRGKNRTAANAHHLWGFCIDLDGVGMDQLRDLLHQIQNDVLPEPTYLVNSGHGFHVYYLLEDPIPLYRHLHQPLNDLKFGLTRIVWNAYTSNIDPEKRQFQGVFQGFRMPGTQSKLGRRYPVVAFRTGKKTTIRTLNDYIEEQHRLTEWDDYRITLEEAKEKYPEWYQKVIVKGDKSKKKWDIAGKVNGNNPYALYDWWLDKVRSGAFDGNRYNCIATLMTYGVKCDVPYERVLNDALELVPLLDRLTVTPNNAFTVQDVYDACTYYDDCYATYSIKAIEARTKIVIPRNKRNKRNRKVHLRMARSNRDILCEERGKEVWWEGHGRPAGSKNKVNKKQVKVQEYRAEYPDATVSQVATALGISRTTVYKWWDTDKEEGANMRKSPEKELEDWVEFIDPNAESAEEIDDAGWIDERIPE